VRVTIDGHRRCLQGQEHLTEECARSAPWNKCLKQYDLIQRKYEVKNEIVKSPGFAHAMGLLVVAAE